MTNAGQDPEDALLRRPLLRGFLHLGACLAAIAGMVVMLLLAHDARGYVGASVFGASLIVAYGTSASYHRLPLGTRMSNFMRRLDHAMIFFLIVGTYTPFCLIVLDNAWGIGLLSVTATIAGVGALTRLAWLDSPRWLAVALYLATGWVALIAASQILQKLDVATLALLFLGGVAYSVGALAYAAKRPDPWPRVFGYHEVFHSFTTECQTLSSPSHSLRHQYHAIMEPLGLPHSGGAVRGRSDGALRERILRSCPRDI